MSSRRLLSRNRLLKPRFQSAYRKQVQELETKNLAIEAAAAAGTSENPPATTPAIEEIERKHANELKALEERLRAEHKRELEAAATNTVPGGTAEKGKDTDIEAAIAAARAEWNEAHEKDIEGAIDRGRAEQLAKIKVKDSQLSKTQGKVKELEAIILELKGSGAVATPKTAAALPQKLATTQPPAQRPTQTQPPAQRPAPTQPPMQKTTPVVNKPQQTATQGKLPNRPALPARGGGPGRVALGGRGGAPMTAPTPQSTGSGVSIMGAAKRPREDAEGEMPTTDNTLAKRLKPAENKPTPPIKRPPPNQ